MVEASCIGKFCPELRLSWNGSCVGRLSCRTGSYLNVLQIDFPAVAGDIGNVEGDWPFGDGLFHGLGRAPFGRGDWLWFWEC